MRYVEQPHREGATGPHFRYRAPIGASWPSRPAGTSAGGRRRVRTAQPSLLATRATGPVRAAHGVHLEPPGRSPQPSGHCRRPFPSGHDAALLAGAQQLWCLQISALVTAARSDAAADRSLVFYPPSHPPTAQNFATSSGSSSRLTSTARLPRSFSVCLIYASYICSILAMAAWAFVQSVGPAVAAFHQCVPDFELACSGDLRRRPELWRSRSIASLRSRSLLSARLAASISRRKAVIAAAEPRSQTFAEQHHVNAHD